MRQKSRRTAKAKKAQSQAQRAADAARAAKVLRVQLALGYGIVGFSVLGGFVIGFWPQLLGQSEGHPAVGIGLALLALFRLYVLRREIRRQEAEDSDSDSASAAPKQAVRTAAGHAS